MNELPAVPRKRRRFRTRVGALCLLAIIPVKLLRLVDHPDSAIMIGVAPSALGPAGLLFLLRSTSGRLSRLSLLQSTLLVGVLATVIEALQLLPRPGILARVSYTFDRLDIVAGLLGTLLAAAAMATGPSRKERQ
jgi:hypothetical protein